MIAFESMNKFTDAQLRTYVDNVFIKFDKDRTGTLSPSELVNFFN